MTDLITPLPGPATPPPTESPDQPPSGPPPVDAPGSSERPPRRTRRRFAAGLATGIAISAVAVGGVALVQRDDDSSGDPTVSPVATVAEAPAAEVAEDAPVSAVDADPPSAVTLVPAGSGVHDLVVAVRPSIVAIHTTITQTDVFGQSIEGAAAGSGFVWSADGYVVTNNHVIDGAAEITVTFDDGTSERADLVAADPRSDLALLHVDRTDLVPLTIGDSDAIRVGDSVVAIGNALDLGAEPTVTGGMVSAKERTIDTQDGQVLVHLLQTDAAISSGNSGGPLLDLNGRVVGINTAVASQGQNIGFAIAISPAKEIVEQLRAGEAPRHALLGVSAQQSLDGTSGALVAAVEPGSAAAAAGVRAGDLITSLGGDPVQGPEDLVAAITNRQPGDEVEIVLERDGETVTLTATLGAHDEVTS